MCLKSKRKILYDKLIENETEARIVKGRNIGVNGVIKRVGNLRDYDYKCGYTKYHYHNYFDLTIKTMKKDVSTSCDHIEIIN